MYEGNSAAPPTWARALEGSPVDPATKTFLLKTKGTRSQQVELRGDGGEKGQCREFFIFTKIESEGFSLSQKVKVIPV